MKKISFFVLIVLIIVSLYGFVQKYKVENTVITISGISVKDKEYKFYLYDEIKRFEKLGGSGIWQVDFDGVSAESVAKQNTLETITLVKISNIEAAKQGIKLTDDDKNSILNIKNTFISNLTKQEIEKIGISDREITRIAEENVLYLKLFNSITKNLQLSDAYVSDYLAKDKSLLNDFIINYVFIKNTESNAKKKAEEILLKIKNQNNFHEEVKNSGEDNESMVSIDKLPTEVQSIVKNMSIGQISNVLNTSQGFYIIQLYDIKQKNINEIKKQKIEEISNQQKKEVFNKQYTEWKKNLKIKVNKELLDKIVIDENN